MEGKKFKPSSIFEGGEKIEFCPRQSQSDFAEPENIPLDVIFEDEDLTAINKPAGMAVHPGAGRNSATLANALAHRYANLSTVGGPSRPGIVHRLDKDTSGVVIIAKNDICHARLASQFAERSVRKEYRAIVCGAMKKNSGTFSSSVGRSPSNRKKMSGNRPAKPRESITDWEIVEKFQDWSFVKIIPKTGRTHQIRVHFSEAGHPIAADSLYGGKTAKLKLASSGLSKMLGRHALHALRIDFLHPVSGKEVSFISEKKKVTSIVCMIENEDYWNLDSIVSSGKTIEFYGYKFVAETPSGSTPPITIAVIELTNATFSIGLAVGEKFKESKLLLYCICQQVPDKQIPISVKLSAEVKKIRYDGDELQRIEYLGLTLEKFYEHKGIKFYLLDFRR